MGNRRRRHKPKNNEQEQNLEALNFFKKEVQIITGKYSKDDHTTYPASIFNIKDPSTIEADIKTTIKLVNQIFTFIPQKLRADLKAYIPWTRVEDPQTLAKEADAKIRKIRNLDRNPVAWDRIGLPTNPSFPPNIDTATISRPIVITNSHKNDHKILGKILKEEHVDPHKVAVIAFDRHLDLLTHGGSYSPEKKACALLAMKRELGVGHVAIVGMPYYTVEGSLDPKDDFIPLEKQMLIYAEERGLKNIPVDMLIEMFEGEKNTQSQPKYSWMLEDGFVEIVQNIKMQRIFEEGSISVHPYNTPGMPFSGTISNLVENLKQAGIEQVVISLDLDVLALWEEDISSTPYSPFALIGIMANMSNSYFKDKLKKIKDDIYPEGKDCYKDYFRTYIRSQWRN